MKRSVGSLVSCLLALTMLLAACGPAAPSPTAGPTPAEPSATPGEPTAKATATGPQSSATPVAASDIYPASFAKFTVPAVALPQAFAGQDYSLPVDLSQVQGLDKVQLSEAQRALLAQNGFVVTSPVPGKVQEFYNIYESARYEEMPVFVTTDSIFHVYHLIFDKMLRDLERSTLMADLKELTSTMLTATTQQYQALQGTALEEQALRNVAYFGVGAQLLGLPDAIPEAARPLVDAEVKLINAASGSSISPIWQRADLPAADQLIEVYDQYLPRGHYTLSEDLERYFRAMMWYGRLTFRLKDDFETQRALLTVQAARTAKAADGTPAMTLWQDIYDPTVFIVGKADDLGIYEYGALSDQVYGAKPQLVDFADAARLAQFKEAAKALPPPQINSMWVWIDQDKEQVTKGFRFMGQRFTLDAYVFGQLIWRNVGTQEKPRGLPKALDFFAAMGSQEAYNILKDAGETQYAKYDAQMSKVRQEITGLQEDSWTQNLYWAWLYALQPLNEPKGASYPAFMRTQAWTRKDLQTALGSWTELKHDTILYAKQVMAEAGGGMYDVPPGYVEPNVEAYARLLALAQMTYDGLEQRGLLAEPTKANLENLMEQLRFLQRVSEQELAGKRLSQDDYDHILYWGGVLEQFTLAAADTTAEYDRDLSDQKAALVADVATGTSPDGALVALEEAIGQPTWIYVVLPDAPQRVAVGAVYSYYEFTVPSGARLTDEAWRAMVAAGTNPAQPDWTQAFIAP